MNEGLKILQNNVKKMIDAGCQDEIISYMISHSTSLGDLNSRIEDELLCIK